MADVVDLCAEQNAAAEDAVLKRRKPEGPPPVVSKTDASGHPVEWVCLNCSEPHDAPVRWCDKDCNEDWTKRQSATQRNGGHLD